MESHFTITSSKNTIEGIEKFFRSPVHTKNRSMHLFNTSHNEGYSVARIIPINNELKIDPADIFFLGLHVGLSKEDQPVENKI